MRRHGICAASESDTIFLSSSVPPQYFTSGIVTSTARAEYTEGTRVRHTCCRRPAITDAEAGWLCCSLELL
jgi:hypothetical protein